jgi:hypothetical protein
MTRKKKIGVRFSDDELEKLQEDARSYNVSVTALLRTLALGRKPPKVVPKINRLTYRTLGTIQLAIRELRPIDKAKRLEDEIRKVRLQILGINDPHHSG